jgi:hypothetical protein
MTTFPYFSFGTTCEKCGEALIAPDCVEYCNEEKLVLNFWICTKCNSRFETEAFVLTDADRNLDGKVLEEFFPSLLVA